MFDDRKKQSEKKFELEAEKKFKIISLRNKYLGLWAAEKLGLSGEDIEKYAKAVIISDFKEVGDQDVIDKVLIDFKEKGVVCEEQEIIDKLNDFFKKAQDAFKN